MKKAKPIENEPKDDNKEISFSPAIVETMQELLPTEKDTTRKKHRKPIKAKKEDTPKEKERVSVGNPNLMTDTTGALQASEIADFQRRVSKSLDESISKRLIDEKEQLEKSYSSLMQKAIIVSEEIDRHRQNPIVNVDNLLPSQPPIKKGWWNKLIKKG